MRILVILPSFPFPPDTGQKHRFAHVAQTLADKHEVALACFAGPEVDPKSGTAHTGGFVDVRLVEAPSAVPGGSIRAWLSPEPSDVRFFRSADMAAQIADLLSRFDPHVLMVGDPGLTPYVADQENRVRVLDYVCEVMLQAERMQGLAVGPQKLLWRLRRVKFAAFLKRIVPVYDLCILNSLEDLESLQRVWPAERLRLITNGLDLSRYPLCLAQPQANRMIYPGSLTYKPNEDAVRWFAEEILPKVRLRVPDAELVVTGAVPAHVRTLQRDGLRLAGFVDDVKRMIASAWVTVVPLRLGAGGARFKVLESMALGTPLVSTAIGYEGLTVTDGVNILKAEDTESFAARTIEILTSPALRTQIAHGGRALMEAIYNWDILGAALEAEIARLGAQR